MKQYCIAQQEERKAESPAHPQHNSLNRSKQAMAFGPDAGKMTLFYQNDVICCLTMGWLKSPCDMSQNNTVDLLLKWLLVN